MTSKFEQKSPETSEAASEKKQGVCESEPCPTRLLEDVPVELDSLSSDGDVGPHDRVARSIAEIIQSDEPGGIMIGIEGGWGAGKSTVIKMLRKCLRDGDKEATVFSFDAWAHEGDPLRRTFLEALIQHFIALDGWVDKEEAGKTLETLAKRRKVTETTTTRSTTKLGKIFATSLLLMPVGIPLFSAGLAAGVTFNSDLPIAWAFVLGLVLVTSPISVLIGNGLILIARRGLKKQEKDATDWAFLKGDDITTVRENTSSTPEPTSIEFEDYFRKLMCEALPGNSSKKAVIVLDNLDRVDVKDALSIWSTLQTFLQDRSEVTEPWFKKLWVIVPYDPKGLQKIWENGADQNQSSVADSFIDKSFQLRFEVPPLVLSNWKGYLKELLSMALPGHGDEDQHTIYRVFNMCRDKGDEAPTPRALKMFVNQIGAIHRQWRGEFPIGHIAYYVALRRKSGDIRAKLLNGELSNSNIESILSSSLDADLAGLTFNVHPHLGQQLLLGSPILDALMGNEPGRLNELEAKHRDGFWAVLEDVVTSQMEDLGAMHVANAILCVDESGICRDRNLSEPGRIIKDLGRVTSKLESWLPFSGDIPNGISTACRLVSDINVSETIIKNLYHSILTMKEKVDEPTITNDHVKGLVEVYEKVHELGHGDVINRPFVFPVNESEWANLCHLIKLQDIERWSLFKPQISFEAISEYIQSLVNTGDLSGEVLDVVKVTEKIFDDSDWGTLAEKLGDRFVPALNANGIESSLLLKGLSLLRGYDTPNAQARLDSLVLAGHLMNSFHHINAQTNVEIKARHIVAYLENNPGASKLQDVGHSAAGYQTLIKLLGGTDAILAEQVCKILHSQGNLNALLEVVDHRDSYDPFVATCLCIVADKYNSDVLFTPDEVMNRWSDLWGNLGEDRFRKLIKHLCETTSFVEMVRGMEDGFKSDDAWLYIEVCKASLSTSFYEWCCSGLDTLDSSVWESELVNSDESGVLSLMLTLMSLGVDVGLKRPYQDAHVAYAKDMLAGTAIPSDVLISNRVKILDGLGGGSERAMLRDFLIKEAIKRDGKCADNFFSMYGDDIASVATPSKNKRVVNDLFIPLVQERAVGGLRWLNEVMKSNPLLLKKFRKIDAVCDFYGRLQDELGVLDMAEDEAHILIVEIANTLGIKPEKQTVATEDIEESTEGDK